MTKLYTDTSANLPLALLREYDIAVIPFSYTVNGVAEDYNEETDFDGKAFYDAMRRGAEVKTSMVNPATAAALVGSVLGIKPILRGDETGHIVSCGKVRGNKKAYAELADYFDKRALDKTARIGIAHADNCEGTDYLLGLLRERGFTGECLEVYYEPVTGAHVGPGTVALFFYGTEK